MIIIIVDIISIVKTFLDNLSTFVYSHKKEGIIMSTIDKISTLLKENKKTQKDLMDFLGLEKSSFTAWKAGKNTSYKQYIKEIADFFGVSTDYLLGKDDEDYIKAYDETGEPLFLDDEVREIVDSLRTRPEMKILFSASKKATKEDIMKTVKIIEALRNGEDE